METSTKKTAIIAIDGKQLKVEEGQLLSIDKREASVGSKISFDKVLFLTNKEGKVSVGAPYVKGGVVEAEVLGSAKGDKVIVFKKKRRKGYAVKNGYHKTYTNISITAIKAV